MKVVVNTPSELIARHRPVVLPAATGLLTLAVAVQAAIRFRSLEVGDAAGYVFGIATGVVIFVLVAGRGEVRFDAASGEVCWRRRVFLSMREGKASLDSITAVTVVTDHGSEAGAQRVVLSTTDGPLPLTWHYSGIEPHEETAEAVRAWFEGAWVWDLRLAFVLVRSAGSFRCWRSLVSVRSRLLNPRSR